MYVQGTNDDAQISKLSCATLGYITDDFVQLFVRRPTRRSPLINRGYYSRHAALRGLMRRFLALRDPFLQICTPGPPSPASEARQRNLPQPPPVDASIRRRAQVLSLGAGFDTAFFQMRKEGQAPGVYFEVDFREVTCRKAAVIQSAPELQRWLGPPEEVTIDADAGRVISPAYRLLPADLRRIHSLEEALEGGGFDFGAPTLVLCECVLVYMEAEESAALVRWLGDRLRCAAMAVYEQILPDDPFGRQMLQNLEYRGCPLKGIHATPDLQAQQRRFKEGGWDRGEALGMDTVYKECLDEEERRRIERLELFDEFEEWNLIQAHYCIALGVNDRAMGLLRGFGLQTPPKPKVPKNVK